MIRISRLKANQPRAQVIQKLPPSNNKSMIRYVPFLTSLYVFVWSWLEGLALFSGMADSFFRSELCETISIKSLSEGKDWTVLNRKQVSFVRRFLTTDNLAVSAQGFRRGANRVRKQMWWKVCFLLALLIIGYENASMSHWRCHNSPCHHYWYNPLQRSLLFLVVAVANDSTDCRQEDIGWKIYTHLGFLQCGAWFFARWGGVGGNR
jgi:hypothetical protein